MADKKEIMQLDEQINMLRIRLDTTTIARTYCLIFHISFLVRYDPLCEHLKEAKDRKKELLEILANCLQDQKEIMGEVKGTIQLRRIEESRLTSKMGSLELETLRVC